METKTGVVEAKSIKTGGIKIGGEWYNTTEATKSFTAEVNKGDTVEFACGADSKLSFVKKIGASPTASPGTPAQPGVDMSKVYAAKDMRSHRSMVLAYAKDLAVADKIKTTEIMEFAQSFLNFVYEDEKKEDTDKKIVEERVG